MNNIFDIKRFGNYLVYDLRRAQSNYLISGLILGLLPVICFVVPQIFSFMFVGHATENFGRGYALTAAVAAMVALVFTFPVKMYGEVTEKRYGSNWLMIPASTFEKVLSMVLMTCIVAPVVIGAVFLASDGLLSLCFGKFYGSSIISTISSASRTMVSTTDGVIDFSLTGFGLSNVWGSMLAFTLGAVFFKKSKAAKTFLAILVAGSILGSVTSGLMISNIMGFKSFVEAISNQGSIEGAAQLFSYFKAFAIVCDVLEFVLLTVGLYFRIKTLKH